MKFPTLKYFHLYFYQAMNEFIELFLSLVEGMVDFELAQGFYRNLI
jgi:hypothetical protein